MKTAHEAVKSYRIDVTMSAKVAKTELPGILRKAGCRLEHTDWGTARDEAVILSKAGGIKTATIVGLKTVTVHHETWENGDLKLKDGKPFHAPLTKKQKREQERPD